jgi:hypothetical protein
MSVMAMFIGVSASSCPIVEKRIFKMSWRVKQCDLDIQKHVDDLNQAL